MQITENLPINFLYHRAETTLDGLEKFLPHGQQLLSEAVKYHFPVTGSVHWHYYGFDGSQKTSFTLEVCVPIGAIPEDYDGPFHLKRTENFPCVVETHVGPWLRIPDTYEKIFKFIDQHNLRPTGNNREIYVNVDFKNPQANLTIIQIGIQRL